MARKSLQGLSGIAKTIADSGPKSEDRKPISGAPALGALQGSLSAIREIDPKLIDEWGPQDRLEGFTPVNSDDDSSDFGALVDSIAEGGQQVPILVRRAPIEGRFQVIYGRRRLKACRELGIKVRANVSDLDDQSALIAKGLENAARRDLSFYEKARFAKVIKAAGHKSPVVLQVLGIKKSALSQMNKVTDLVPDKVGDAIGAAPNSGRPKWTKLAEAFATNATSASAAFTVLARFGDHGTSDDRLDALLAEIARRGARRTDDNTVSVVDGVTIKKARGAVSVSIKRGAENAEFAEWLSDELEEFISASYKKFTAVNFSAKK